MRKNTVRPATTGSSTQRKWKFASGRRRREAWKIRRFIRIVPQNIESQTAGKLFGIRALQGGDAAMNSRNNPVKVASRLFI